MRKARLLEGSHLEYEIINRFCFRCSGYHQNDAYRCVFTTLKGGGTAMGLFDRGLRGRDEVPSTEAAAAGPRSPEEQRLVESLGARGGDVPVRYALRFTGRVQGVGFRWTNRQLASERHLTGWVRNMPDGSVTMEIQGAPAAIVDHLAAVHASFSRYGDGICLAHASQLPCIPGEGEFEVRY